MSQPSIAAHERQFDGWPTLRPAVGAYMPERDGDIAELDELQERVFDELDARIVAGESVTIWHDDDIHGSMRFWFNMPIFHYWPDDRAAEQLAVWRASLDGIA